MTHPMAKNLLRSLLILHIILHGTYGIFPPCEDGPCGIKQFYDDKTSSCRDCPENQFMNFVKHKCKQCFRCTTADDFLNEIVLKMCTPEADTVIGCKDRYYRVESKISGDCYRCSICSDNEEMVKPCGLFSDTECRSVAKTVHKTDGEHSQTNRMGRTVEPDLTTAAEEKPNMTKNVNEAESQSIETKDGTGKKPKCLTLAGLTDDEDDRSITEVLAIIIQILLPFIITFSVLLLDFFKWTSKRRARRV